MQLKEWLDDVDDRFIEVGGSPNAKFQCVDCANDFLNRVLGEPMVFGTDAVNFWDKTNLKQIQPTTYPQAGDIVIWNKNVGGYGHIAVATGIINGNKFQTMSQNWPLKTPCHLQDYELKNLIGYLRKDNMECEKALAEMTAKLEAKKKEYNSYAYQMNKRIAERDKQIKDLEAEQIKIMQEQEEAIKKINDGCQVKIEALSSQLSTKCPKCPVCEMTTTVDKQSFIEWLLNIFKK